MILDQFKLDGKVAIVTGAGRGIGQAYAIGLAEAGADVAIVDVIPMDETIAAIQKLGRRAIGIKADLSKGEKESPKIVAKVVKAFKKIDILVNNAGVGDASPAAEMTDETWRKVIGTNLDAVYFVAREVGKVMIKNGYGKIINIGSLHSEVAMMAWPVPAYAAAKGGVKMLTKALAAEWAKCGITVNAIGPAYFNSEMTAGITESDAFAPISAAYIPMGRPGREGELDGALIYFASDASSYTTGQLLCVDGGWTTI